MQPIVEIFKRIGLPILIFWAIAILLITIAFVCAIREHGTEVKTWQSILPLQGIATLLITMGLIFYSANDSIKREKEFEQSTAKWRGQLAAMQSSRLAKEEKTIVLDQRLQSVEGVIGYLEQSIKMGKEPGDLAPIVLVLAQEIKNLRDGI